MTKQFYTAPQCGLRVNGEFVRIGQNNGFEIAGAFGIHMCLGEKFQFITYKFNAFPVCAIDIHDIIFD